MSYISRNSSPPLSVMPHFDEPERACEPGSVIKKSYREWARDQLIERGIYKKPENLHEPLQTIDIKPGADQGWSE